jgi:hypothetical protein
MTIGELPLREADSCDVPADLSEVLLPRALKLVLRDLLGLLVGLFVLMDQSGSQEVVLPPDSPAMSSQLPSTALQISLPLMALAA